MISMQPPERRRGQGLREGAWAPHPAVWILLWTFLAIALQSLHTAAVLAAGTLLILVAVRLSAVRLYRLLRRTRWVMFSLLLIYGYVTPGAALWSPADVFSPTLEGLGDGLLQLCRLVLALAGLSIVLSVLSQAQLISGLYAIAYPLRLLGLSRERIAVRLSLTLHYAERAMLETAADWRGSIGRVLAPQQAGHPAVELRTAPLTLRDGLLIAAGGAALALLL